MQLAQLLPLLPSFNYPQQPTYCLHQCSLSGPAGALWYVVIQTGRLQHDHTHTHIHIHPARDSAQHSSFPSPAFTHNIWKACVLPYASSLETSRNRVHDGQSSQPSVLANLNSMHHVAEDWLCKGRMCSCVLQEQCVDNSKAHCSPFQNPPFKISR